MDNIYRLSVPAADQSAPAAPAAGTPVAPVPAAKPSDKDAYLNKISHVVLYNSHSGQTGDQFNIVGQSVLDAAGQERRRRRAATGLPAVGSLSGRNVGARHRLAAGGSTSAPGSPGMTPPDGGSSAAPAAGRRREP